MPLEYSLLCLLAQNIGKVLTYRFILEKVWQNGITSDISSLRVYMASLRKNWKRQRTFRIYPDAYRSGLSYGQCRRYFLILM